MKNFKLKGIWISFCLLCMALPGWAEQLDLMPLPSHIVQQPGYLALDHTPRIHVEGGDERVQQALTRFVQTLAVKTGVPFNRQFVGIPDGPPLTIQCGSKGSRVQNIDEDESYKLAIGEAGIQLTAPNPLGIMHGLQTLLQLAFVNEHGWVLPYVQIDDAPRFAWRGLMIDVSRHFMPLDAVERNIDAMAAVKLNVFHWHLSDDEGFRVESKRYPRLTSAGSGGQFYTQQQVRDLILYARNRGIRVVPEFDVPGHSVSWLVAYPELATGAAPTHIVQSEHDDLRPPLDPTRESTYKLLDQLFGEMEGLFPDQYFHIGGDEVDEKYWENDPKIRAWMQSHNIKDAHALQTYFTERVQKIVRKHGKTMEGWDEILDGDIPKDCLIQSWRGANSLASAARMGYKTVLSAGYYLDLMYPASQHYAVDPLGGESASLPEDKKRNILGGEAAQWTASVTPDHLDNRIWPRLGAIAERLWSPSSVTDVDSMYRRLAVLSRNLLWLDIDSEGITRKMLRRIEGDDLPPELLETLAMAVEPVKEYDREVTQVYDATQALNHLVDAAPPESDAARQINALAVRAVQDPTVRPALRSQLIRWRDNDARIQPYLVNSALRQPLVPVSQDLSKLGTLGLVALDNLEAGKSISAESRKEQLAEVQAAAAHHAEMFLVVTPAVRVLIEAESGGH